MTPRISIKKLLLSYVNLKIRLHQKQTTLDMLEKKYPAATSNYNYQIGHLQGLANNETQTLAVRNVEIEEKHYRLKTECDDLEYTINLIDNVLYCLPKFEADIIRQYYFTKEKPGVIAQEFGYSRQWVIKHLHIALQKLESVFNNLDDILINKYIPLED